VLIVFAFVSVGRISAGEPIRIGSKASIENIILGEILSHLARESGFPAHHESSLGGTQIVFQALVKGDIDIYPEYTGTLIAEILQNEKIRGEDELQTALEKRNLAISRPLGFNNTYALGLREERAVALNLLKISDLAKADHQKLKLAFSDEFMRRGDGWPGLSNTYKLPHQPKTMDHNLAYRGLVANQIDLTDLYSTDAEVKYYKLRILDDDRGYFPEYNCVLLYRRELASSRPEVLKSLLRLESQIDNAAMSEMNARAKMDQVPEMNVAADFLTSKLGLAVKMPRKTSLLVTTTRDHLFLVGLSLAAAIIIALPLGVWSYKWPQLGHAILGVVGIIQTLPSMAVLVFMIPLLGIGPWPAITALFLYSLLPIVRGTVTGLREIPGNLKESAIVLGLPPRARLWLVELPMASRSILAGIKTAAVINVGTATIGALIGAGGYGEPILAGLRLNNWPLTLQGAVPAALLALLVQAAFEFLEPFLVPRGLRIAAASKG
jgi:osmoprotectant transport system permease protein